MATSKAMKKLKPLFISLAVVVIGAALWLGLLYRTYGFQTLIFLFSSPPEFLLTYSKNLITSDSSAASVKSLLTGQPVATSTGFNTPTTPPIEIPAKHYIKVMSHAYQKLNNCGPVSASMAASTLGTTFDQFYAADVLKGTYTDKNVAPDEMVAFLRAQGLETIYRVNGNASQIEQLVSQDIPVITEQWLVKRGSGEMVGHYRVVRGYDQNTKVFTTNDSFNGPNFIIPYTQFDEWWRPFNRGYLVVYKPEQENLVKRILGTDWDEKLNAQGALRQAQSEVNTIGDGYSHFNVGTNANLVRDYTLAAKAYDTALTKTFPPDLLWYQFGPHEAYYQTGQYDRVLKLTSEVLGKAGEIEEVRYYRGITYAKLGQKNEARTELEKALQANPRYTKATTALNQL